MMDGSSRLPIDVVAALFLAIWVLVAVSWAVILHWEKTSVTEARRQELEREASGDPSIRIRAWRVMTLAVLVWIPLLFAIDGLAYGIGILYSPSLSFLAGSELVLQIAGIVL